MKICAEGSEVVLRLTIEEARKAAVAGPSGLARRALTGDPQWVMGLVKAADQAQAAIDLASGAREYLRAERFDRRVEEGQIDAARLAFEAERAQARKDYGFTDEPSPADAAQELTDRRYPDREGRVEGVDR